MGRKEGACVVGPAWDGEQDKGGSDNNDTPQLSSSHSHSHSQGMPGSEFDSRLPQNDRTDSSSAPKTPNHQTRPVN